MSVKDLRKELLNAADSAKARMLQRFFKTGKGEYGEGDVFLGIVVPLARKIANKHASLSFSDIEVLLQSKIHEERLVGLLVLVEQYSKHADRREDIFDFYLAHASSVNNWDLVDLSADKIVGRFLYDFGKNYPVYLTILSRLSESSNIWERRIAIISTFYFIKQWKFDETFFISEKLLKDKHDLIHKAVGWMLREVGKRDQKAEENFLRAHYSYMPRTMLRYAIERFEPALKKRYMKGTIEDETFSLKK